MKEPPAPPSTIPPSYNIRYPEGESPKVPFLPGDFILVHHPKNWTSRIIRFGQRLRFRGPNRQYAHWNHAALIVSADGHLIEAIGAGVSLTHIDCYRPKDYTVVFTGASAQDRAQVCRVARRMVGYRYGFLTILSLALALLTGTKFSFGVDGQAICSGLVARALERTDAIFDRTPQNIMPADLARYYDVRHGEVSLSGALHTSRV